MTVRLTIHRSADQIGGNCIEIVAESGERLVLDVGRPLDAPNDATGLLPSTLDRETNAHVLISHPHQDHYGLLEETPPDWPVYSGAAAEKLIRITAGITGGTITRSFTHWRDRTPTRIGPFTITPYLTDHSAFDAYMLLIETEQKRILYTGDFRIHGRKSVLVEKLMAEPPQNLDVLLMEGTNLGSDKPTMSEADLEGQFVSLFQETAGRVFVAWSAQNVDRTVTLFRAARKTGRTLVVDIYTAEVMNLLAEHGRLPQAGWDNLKVVVTASLSRRYKQKGLGDFVDKLASSGHAISARTLSETPEKWAIMLRESLVRDYERKGVKPAREDAWSWSMWKGYLDKIGVGFSEWLHPAHAQHIHTSGHASPADLRRFAASMKPKALVPIHSFTWDENTDGFPAIHRLRDGETLSL